MTHYRLLLNIGGVEAIRTDVLNEAAKNTRFNNWSKLYPPTWISVITVPADNLLAY
jgi:hypothetical protein